MSASGHDQSSLHGSHEIAPMIKYFLDNEGRMLCASYPGQGNTRKYIKAICNCASKGIDIRPGKTSVCLIRAKATLDRCVAARVDIGE